jgi:hypothetical protein
MLFQPRCSRKDEAERQDSIVIWTLMQALRRGSDLKCSRHQPYARSEIWHGV